MNVPSFLSFQPSLKGERRNLSREMRKRVTSVFTCRRCEAIPIFGRVNFVTTIVVTSLGITTMVSGSKSDESSYVSRCQWYIEHGI